LFWALIKRIAIFTFCLGIAGIYVITGITAFDFSAASVEGKLARHLEQDETASGKKEPTTTRGLFPSRRIDSPDTNHSDSFQM